MCKLKKVISILLVFMFCTGLISACGLDKFKSDQFPGEASEKSEFKNLGNDPNNIFHSYYSKGLLAFDENHIYYPDEGTVVQMNYDGSEKKTIKCPGDPKYLNIYNNCAYYVSDRYYRCRVFQTNLETGESEEISQVPQGEAEWVTGDATSMIIADGYLFYGCNYCYTVRGDGSAHYSSRITAIDLADGSETRIYDKNFSSDIKMTVSADMKLYAFIETEEGFENYYLYSMDINEYKNDKYGTSLVQVVGSTEYDYLETLMFSPDGIYYMSEDPDDWNTMYYYKKNYDDIDPEKMKWYRSDNAIVSTDVYRNEASSKWTEDEKTDWQIFVRLCSRFKLGNSLLMYSHSYNGQSKLLGYPDMDFEKEVEVASIETANMSVMSYDELMEVPDIDGSLYGIYKGTFYIIEPTTEKVISITEEDIKAASKN